MPSPIICLALVVAFFSLAGLQPAKADSFSTGLIAHWTFDGSGADTSGHGYNLTLFGHPGFGPGRFGQALSLTGDISQYAARLGDDPAFDFGSHDFTVQMWAKFNSHPTEQTLIEKFSGCCGAGWTFTTTVDSRGLQFYSAGQAVNSNIGNFYPLNQWDQYVVEKNGATASLFFNGVLIGTGLFPADLSASPNPLLIGKRNPDDGRGFPVNGLLDDAAIWSRALAPTEIHSLYINGFSSPTPEPGSLLLNGTGLLGVLGAARRKWLG